MITLKRLAEEMQAYDWVSGDEEEEASYRALKQLLVESLPDVYKSVYRYAVSTMRVDSREVADECKMSIQHASTVLKALADYGLLLRYPVVSETGLFWQYVITGLQVPCEERGE